MVRPDGGRGGRDGAAVVPRLVRLRLGAGPFRRRERERVREEGRDVGGAEGG